MKICHWPEGWWPGQGYQPGLVSAQASAKIATDLGSVGVLPGY